MLYMCMHHNLLLTLIPSSMERSVFATLLDRRSRGVAVEVEEG